MANPRPAVLVALALCGCKRDDEPRPAPPPVVARDAGAVATAAAEPTWYRAIIRAPSGVEARFFLGVAPGQAILKVGAHEVHNAATFDRATLSIPFTVYQTAVDATAGSDGALTGAFSTRWRAWGASSLPLAATKVAAPTTSALATAGSDGAPIDLGEPRTIWRLAMSESGVAKVVVTQTAPGDFEGLMFLDTGNLIYLAGNGRGDALVLTGFDGTSGYRLELALDGARARARGAMTMGHRLDSRETLTATRAADFALASKPKGAKPHVKVGLPDLPQLAALAPGPLVVEISGSWCSTCRDAAPVLDQLYRASRPRGLQMVTLLYELSGDPAADAKQAEAFARA